jgi:hypothetical protein
MTRSDRRSFHWSRSLPPSARGPVPKTSPLLSRWLAVHTMAGHTSPVGPPMRLFPVGVAENLATLF